MQLAAELIFLGSVATTFVGAAIAIFNPSLIRGIAGLALSFLGVAGIYYFLSSPFLTFMQVLIYIGAICVTLVFAVMLSGNSAEKKPEKRKTLPTLMAALACSAFTGLLLYAALTAQWKAAPSAQLDGSLERIGEALLSTYSMSFELISVVLVVAMIGALLLSRDGRDKQ
jgi:NADH-quinone oxidoreductase subunit J